jgi:type I restriction enzyme, S subunit
MSEWREVVLGDLCDRVTVGHVGKMADRYVDDGVPFLRSQNVKPFVVDPTGMLRIDEGFHEKLAKSVLNADDVVVVRTGYPGTAAVIPSAYDGANCADLVVITPGNDLNPHVLAAIFNSAWGRSAVGGQVVGAAQQHFNVSSAKALRVRLPSRSVQDRIAEVLCAFHDLIENNRRRVEVLEGMARAIYREWFVHFRYPGHEDVPLVESPVGLVPEGWRVTTAGEVFEVVLGGTPSRKKSEYWAGGTVPWVTSTRVNDLRVLEPSELITLEALGSCNAKVMPRRTTLIAITGATLGQVSALEIEACANQSVVGVFDPDGALSEYVYLWFKVNIGSVISHASGSAQQHINKGTVSSTQLALPSHPVIDEFKALAGPTFDLIGELLASRAHLAAIRELLLPKLVTGQIDVSRLDLDALTEALSV